MAQTHKLRKYKSLFSTTLSTGIGTGTGDTITPASVSELPTDTEITLTFDRVNSSGTATPSSLERITGTISGGNFTSYTRGVDGTTEQAHSSNAVIEMIWNADDWNDMIDWALTEHNQDGTHEAAFLVSSYISGSAVTASKIAASAVIPGNLAASSVLAGNLAASSVRSGNLAASSVVLGNLAASSVSEGNLNFTPVAATRTRSHFIPASHMVATVGAPATADSDDTGVYYVFTDSADLSVGTTWVVPQDYSSGDITIYVYFLCNGNSGDVRLRLRRTAFTAQDEDVTTSVASTTFTEAAITTANDLKISAGQAISGATATDMLSFSIGRLGSSDGADTLTGNIGFLGVRIDYTSSA